MIKLSKWAKQQGISYTTAYRWYRAGKIKHSRQLETGMIVIDQPMSDAEEKLRRIKEILDE